jgi:hypothetical protein
MRPGVGPERITYPSNPPPTIPCRKPARCEKENGPNSHSRLRTRIISNGPSLKGSCAKIGREKKDKKPVKNTGPLHTP